MSIAGPILAGVLGLGLAVSLFGSAYVVNEGNMAVITNMSKAERQEGPNGLQFKMPFVTGVKEFDVRERAMEGQLNASTSNELNAAIEFSVNWRPDPDQIMNIYINYGSPEEFVNNVIKQRLQQSLKATVGKFSGSDLTRKREEIADAMLTQAQATLGSYPIIISSVQIVNFALPARYQEAILVKEEQREATERQELILEQQAIKARETIQTAEADRDSAIAEADGQAYAVRVAAVEEAASIRLIAEAEADGIEAIQQAISANPLFIEYERVKSWDGTLPVTVMGDTPSLLMNMN